MMEEGKLHPVVKLAKETVEMVVRDKETPHPRMETPEMAERAGVFVSIHKHGQLRGCIGTFEPTQPNVAQEIIRNAVASATRDYRFFPDPGPVSEEELPELTYKVDILTTPEPVERESELDPVKYGVLVVAGNKKGILLPDLPGVNSVAQQIDIARSKAGIFLDEPAKLFRFEVRRYE
ncbi:MAG: AmmeMemoRadiSam system protein A [Dehalococcoidia bacterium]